jgi:DNA-binding response OmpR family regulator
MLKKNTILLADDEPQNIEVLFNSLECEDYNIIVANDGQQAIVLSQKVQPDVIIMDWDMPNVNGIEAVIAIRANADTVNIPIIMATGKMIGMENMTKAFEAGVNDFLQKPLESIEIIVRVRSMIRYYDSFRKNIEYEKQIAKQKIDLLKEEIEANKQELLRITNHAIQLNKFNINFLNNLEKIKNVVPSNFDLIDKMATEIKLNKTMINWEEFDVLFDKVNVSYIDKLTELYPKLSKNERRLCVFLKLNLSTKDISVLTLQSEDALKKARYRLKKKLGIGNQKLTQFLQNI